MSAQEPIPARSWFLQNLGMLLQLGPSHLPGWNGRLGMGWSDSGFVAQTLLGPQLSSSLHLTQEKERNTFL